MRCAAKQRFAMMVSALSRPLYRYAYWLCGDSAQAQDLLQESLMRAWRALRQALLRPPVQCRKPLLLQAVEGRSLDKIARMLDLPANTVATRLRSRAMLRPEQGVAAGGGHR